MKGFSMQSKAALFPLVLTTVMAIAGSASLAQTDAAHYPQRPITVIVPTGAGSAPDVLVRKIGQGLAPTLGQPFIVENRPGGNGTLGANAVARAAPDGYTLLLGFDSTMTINPALYPSLSYDPQKDFTPITAMGRTPFVLVANPSFPPNTLQEFIAFAKANPGKINYASAGVGSLHQLSMEDLAARVGIHLVHVPYSGGPAELRDIVGGQVPIGFIGIAPALPLIKSGQLKALAVQGKQRFRDLPAVPTVDETLPGYAIEGSWLGLFAPAGTPDAIVNKLSTQINQLLKDKAIDDFLISEGIVPMGLGPAAFRELIRDDTARYKSIIEKTGIHIE
jgi:tripartite-type tricarboxylate transporter receptor subunit TctC